MDKVTKRILPSIEEALNMRIQGELYSSILYENMANWCKCYGFFKLTDLFRKYASEELSHMHIVIDYIIDRNGEPKMLGVPSIPNEYTSLLNILEIAYQHEIAVTEAYVSLVKVAKDAGDEVTYAKLQELVKEQIEEEAKFNDALIIACRLGLTDDYKGTEWYTLEELITK